MKLQVRYNIAFIPFDQRVCTIWYHCIEKPTWLSDAVFINYFGSYRRVVQLGKMTRVTTAFVVDK